MIPSEQNAIDELGDQLAACKAKNKALREALSDCLPVIEEASDQMSLKKFGSHRGMQMSVDEDRRDIFLQAEHIRSLLGLPQP